MGFSIRKDMTEILNNPDRWENHGRSVIEDNCTHHEKDEEENNIRYKGFCDECGFNESSCVPMMNFLYPLELSNFEDTKILEVINKTNCTILEDTESGEYFLALCGGGMDLSQDIALAYLILEKWIPGDLLRNTLSQKAFSISKENYKILRKAIIEQAKIYSNFFLDVKKKWEKVKD